MARQADHGLEAIAGRLEEHGASIRIEIGAQSLQIGSEPPRASVRIGDSASIRALARRDHLALAEAYMTGAIEVEGSFVEVMRVLDLVSLQPSLGARLGFALRSLLPGSRWRRDSIAFHYDRPPEFFLPWLDRWRSYSHGFYETPDDDPSEAQARKLAFAIEAMALKPGDRVLDTGAGWGSFVEFAGRRGIRVHAITISHEQYAFVGDLIRRERLPCTVELVDFFQLLPRDPYDAVVFMGTLEHLLDFRNVTRFLNRHLAPAGRIYADFCAQHRDTQVGAFMARHIWPGTASYVDPVRLLQELVRGGFNIWELRDDTSSYGHTVRHWADGLDRSASTLGRSFDPEWIRAFRLFLRGSQYFLETNRTQAYHLVASRLSA